VLGAHKRRVAASAGTRGEAVGEASAARIIRVLLWPADVALETSPRKHVSR